MKSIQIKNFRSLSDTGNIELKPITVLVGKNSAGKSTFVRTFPLFKQSVEERTRTPILLYSRNGVDFGTFQDVKSIFATDDDYLEFKFTIPSVEINEIIRRNSFLYYSLNEIAEAITIDISITMKINADSKDTPILEILELEIFDNTITLMFDVKKHIVEKIYINNEIIEIDMDLSYFNRGFIADRFIFRDTKTNRIRYDLEDYFEEKLFRLISSKVRKGTSSDNINNILKRVTILNFKKDFLSYIKDQKTNSTTWDKKINNLNIDDKFFNKLYEYTFLYNLENILQYTNSYFRETFHQVKYIAPVRATAERYYRIQDLAIDEVDPHGQNLPMFIGSLSDSMMKKFQNWTEENFGFKVKIKRIEGHYSIKIVYDDDFEVNISDMGFGYSQILPIITQLWYSSEQRDRIVHPRLRDIPIIFVIEQPELHLHPEFQAKFADVIVKIINNIEKRKITIKLIIETHSQTIINRLGLNISDKRIDKNKINIVIFNKLNENEPTRVSTANFDNDGLLENWPIGFFKPSSL
jgi:predicted ATPase